MSSVVEPVSAPAARGYRMPAEWEPHEATWIAWPHYLRDWPGKFAPVPWVFGEIARKICPGEQVRILARSRREEAAARRTLKKAGAALDRTRFYTIPTERAWMRDLGPIFIRRENPQPRCAIAGFRFNAWAKYPDWRLDCRVAERIASALDLPVLPSRLGGTVAVLEGGSIDVNGKGSLLTTEECLLDQHVQARNPGAGRSEIEGMLHDALGVTNVIWLGKGLAGDDTHGHVDDLCRFVGPRTIVLSRESSPSDVNYLALEENRERLQGVHLEDGSSPDIVFLPMPSALSFNGARLPASYANFYLTNGAVLVPTFNDPNDRVALGILAELFPGRIVVGIHCVDLVLGLGTLHCLTQQQPSG